MIKTSLIPETHPRERRTHRNLYRRKGKEVRRHRNTNTMSKRETRQSDKYHTETKTDSRHIEGLAAQRAEAEEQTGRGVERFEGGAAETQGCG